MAEDNSYICENNLYIECQNIEHKEKLIHILENGVYLFQSFIALQSSPLNSNNNLNSLNSNNNLNSLNSNNKLYSYGTSSDIYIEYITVDIDFDPFILSLYFYTHDLPPLEFCKKLSIEYNVNIQLVYFNKNDNYSGNFSIKDKRISCNQIYSYYQGMYLFERDRFWEIIEESFLDNSVFEIYLQKVNINLENMDFQKIKYMFDDFQLSNKFKNL